MIISGQKNISILIRYSKIMIYKTKKDQPIADLARYKLSSLAGWYSQHAI
jgi:hypothetical protein